VKIAAVMATRFNPPQRKALLETLRADGIEPVVMADAGPHPDDWSLYRLWNAGVRYAIERGAEYIAVLNDDVTILPETLDLMAEALIVHDKGRNIGVIYPDVRRRTSEGLGDLWPLTPTTGTWGAGGMTGFCFMFRADLGIPFDERYQLWYGDDAFEEAVRAKGLLVARIDGLPIDHTANGSTSQLPDGEAGERIARDRARWDSRLRVIVQHNSPTFTVTA
jgi:GT2 family glycosyltransferase